MPDEINPEHGTGFLLVANWSKWQTFRKDRGTPDWIKLHRCALTSGEWGCLSDAEKGQLVSMWLVASDRNGKIPNDDRVVRKLAQLDDYPDLSRFIELGLLVPERLPGGNQVVTTWLPDGDQVVTSRSPGGSPRVEKSREEKNINTEDSIYSSEPKKSSAPSRIALLVFPLVGKRAEDGYEVHQEQVDEWQRLFPGIDVMQELRNCLAWNVGNPSRRKTRQGITRHITAWLTKAQDSAGRQPQRRLTALEQSEDAIRKAIAASTGKTYEH